jgi:predicted phage tail protein
VVDDSIAPPPLSSSYELSNLSPGTAYTVYMRAVNAVGAGPWSAPQGFVTSSPPIPVVYPPGAPVIMGVTAGQTSAQVAFTADDSGGSTITRLEFALDDTTAVDDSTTSLSSPYTLSNLSPGTGYTVYMRAVNAVGAGSWSAPQGFVTSSPPLPPPVYPPGAPTGALAVAGDASASVSWVAPSDSGSYPMSTYQVTSTPGGRSCLVAVPALTCTVSGLTNGTSYTFTVRALNGAGWGASSGPSNAVTPRATPGKTIQITGSRDASDTRVVRVSGTTTGLVGEQVTPWVRFPEQTTFMEGTGVRTVAADGAFAWSRTTSKKVHVYFTHGSVKSNTVVIPAR